MVIDVRGLRHPEHLKKFKSALEGFCAVHDPIEVLADDDAESLKWFRAFLHSCRAKHRIEKEAEYVRIIIEPPLSFCG